jgi:hypothetical protein
MNPGALWVPPMAGGDHEFDGATVRRLAHVRSSNLSRLLVDVQPLKQFGRLNIHRQLRNNMNPISTTKSFRGRMYRVSVGFDKKARGKRLYPALPDLPGTPFISILSVRITIHNGSAQSLFTEFLRKRSLILLHLLGRTRS